MPTASHTPRELTPAGNHIGRVYSVIHIGVIQGEYMGQPNEMDKIRIGFELPNETKVFKEGEEPKPYSISEEYTLSMGNKSNLRPVVEGIIGAKLTDQEAYAFDLNDLIGYPCMVNIVHQKAKSTGNEFAKITTTAPLPKGIEAPTAVNTPFILDYTENWSDEKFDSLPAFIKEKMTTSSNYRNKFRDVDNEDPFEKNVELEPLEDMDFEPKEETVDFSLERPKD